MLFTIGINGKCMHPSRALLRVSSVVRASFLFRPRGHKATRVHV